MEYVFHALLVAIATGVTALVVWPMRRDSPRALLAVVVLVPVCTLALYRIVGTPAALDPTAAQRVQESTPASFAEAIARLREELEREPDQPEGWALLARSYAVQQDHANARDSFARALQFAPDDPQLLVEGAQARAQADAQSLFDDEAVAMLRRAVALQPENQRAQWFIGIAQRQRGQHAEAADTWAALLPLVDEATASSLQGQIDAARAEVGLPPLPRTASTPPAPVASDMPNALTVQVSLDPAFAERARLRGDTTVFVIARSPDGPPMPVAVEKRRVSELPLQALLDDNDSPMPTLRLSELEEVEVIARLSESGNATRQPGDIDSAPVRVKLPASGPIELVIGDQ